MTTKDLRSSPFWNPSTFGENRRIDAATADIGALHSASAAAEKQILRLLELDRQQGHEIAKLQSVVYVLMQLLVESGAVDPVKMSERIQAALTQLEANPTWSPTPGV
jgi:hypothetical protein